MMSLRIGLVLIALANCAVCSNTGWAQQLTTDQEKRIGMGINLIKLGCGTGSSHEKAQVGATGDFSLSLKKLPGVTVGGNFDYSSEEAQGLATALQKEISAEGAKLSQAQLECMRPYIDKIFNVLFPDQTPQLKPSPTASDQPASAISQPSRPKYFVSLEKSRAGDSSAENYVDKAQQALENSLSGAQLEDLNGNEIDLEVTNLRAQSFTDNFGIHCKGYAKIAATVKASTGSETALAPELGTGTADLCEPARVAAITNAAGLIIGQLKASRTGR